MRKLFLNTCRLILLFCCSQSVAQSRFYKHNQLEIDRVKAAHRISCRAYESSRQTPPNKNKADKKMIAFLNDFYNKNLSADEVTKKINPFFRHKWKFKTTDLGGSVKYETQIYSEGNLRTFISFTLFQNEIVYKRIYFETETKTNCLSPARESIDSEDINYLDVFCIPFIDFPISFCARCGPVQCDTTNYEKIKNYEASGYKLITADSIYINNMVWYKDDIYKMDYVETDFFTIANNHNTYLLYQLLYSPNHIVAIYSLEALTFLQVSGIVKLPAYIEQKLEDIQNSPIKISCQYSDVVKSGVTYKELSVSKEKIMAKYKESLQKQL